MNAAVSGGSIVQAKVSSVDSASTNSAPVAMAVSRAKAPSRIRIPGCSGRWTAGDSMVVGAGFTGTSRAKSGPRARIVERHDRTTAPARCHRLSGPRGILRRLDSATDDPAHPRTAGGLVAGADPELDRKSVV